MLTGNILQAWSDATQNGMLPGRLVSYTDIDGNIKDGILMNSTWQANQLRSAGYSALYPKQGDFLINHHDLFEVGGKGKTFAQIKDLPDSYLAVDDVEIGSGHRIPLWMFGLLY